MQHTTCPGASTFHQSPGGGHRPTAQLTGWQVGPSGISLVKKSGCQSKNTTKPTGTFEFAEVMIIRPSQDSLHVKFGYVAVHRISLSLHRRLDVTTNAFPSRPAA